MDTRKAQLGREWQPLTEEHTRQLSEATGAFDSFQQGDTVDPLAIVGAYRSGKTQLIYHLFEQAWERGIPAFYVGDPGAMLSEFGESEESNLETWIEEQIEVQLEAYANGDADGVDWFPNTDSATKREWIETHGEFENTDEVSRTALFFDEVEQSYRAFIKAMDKDDDNPLRKINDNLQDTIKVWSFGMISAFEFIGEADWGRMKEIRIPPLTVSDVREVLSDRRPDATGLANTIWWLARGRTGLIIKLIDELPEDVDEGAIDWFKDCAEADFKDTRLVNNLWTSLDRREWDPAIEALLFRADGLDAWQRQDDKAVSMDTCQELVLNIAADEFDFPESEAGDAAPALLDRNVERVFHALAYGPEQLFPRLGLMEEEEADAFLDLVGNMIVSFEPASDERRLALDALEAMEGGFATQWVQNVSDREQIDTSVSVPKPSRIRDAFPPIAVNPERVAGATSEDLRTRMDRGLELDTDDPDADLVTIKFCPTIETATAELEELTRGADITEPTLLVVPDNEEFDLSLDEAGRAYERESLLRIEPYQSNRFWSFVLNLHGRLAEEGVENPYFIDRALKSELVNSIEDREVRNTIETLYDQLDQVAKDEMRTFGSVYREEFSLTNVDTLLWDEERLSGQTPYWSNGRFDEATVAISYLPVLGPEYESTRKYAKLHHHLYSAIQNDLVSGGSGGFGYTEYFENMFTQSGYSQSVKNERLHYRNEGGLDPAVQRTESTLRQLAEHNDLSTIISGVDNGEESARNGDIPVLGVAGLKHMAYPLLRAIFVRGVTTGSDPSVEVDKRLENVIDRLERKKDVVETFIEQVQTVEADLEPPESANIGTWIDVNASRLEDYQQNISTVIEGVEDLIEKCRADSEAAPMGYHYHFLLDEYIEDIGEEVDNYQSDIQAASVSNIADAKNLFDAIYEEIETADAVPLHFDTRESLLAEFEAFGEEIFDLERHHGATAISLPEDQDDLRQLDDTVGSYIESLSRFQEALGTIERESQTLETEFQTARQETETLLTPSMGDSDE